MFTKKTIWTEKLSEKKSEAKILTKKIFRAENFHKNLVQKFCQKIPGAQNPHKNFYKNIPEAEHSSQKNFVEPARASVHP